MDRARTWKKLRVAVAEHVDLGDVRLAQAGSLEIHVPKRMYVHWPRILLIHDSAELRDSATPRFRTLLPRSLSDQGPEPRWTARADTLPAGRYVILTRALKTDWVDAETTKHRVPSSVVSPRTVVLRPGERQELELAVVPACDLSLEIEAPAKAGLQLRILRLDGLLLARHRCSLRHRFTLPRGPTLFELRDDEGRLRLRRTLQLPAGPTEEILRLR